MGDPWPGRFRTNTLFWNFWNFHTSTAGFVTPYSMHLRGLYSCTLSVRATQKKQSAIHFSQTFSFELRFWHNFVPDMPDSIPARRGWASERQYTPGPGPFAGPRDPMAPSVLWFFSDERITLIAGMDPPSQEWTPRGVHSKTRVHGICFSQIRVPPPCLYRFGVIMVFITTPPRRQRQRVRVGYSYLAEANSVNAGFGNPPTWGGFLRSTCNDCWDIQAFPYSSAGPAP